MIFIKGNVASSKNSQRWTGRFLIKSKTTMEYEKTTAPQWKESKEKFLKMIEGKKKPLLIGFYFVRGTRHKHDFINALQTVQDLMVKHEWIEDDNTAEMFPRPFKIKGRMGHYDKEAPGVFIKVF